VFEHKRSEMLLQEGKEEDDMDGMEAIDIDQESDK
jgi:hypothetical protein